MNLVGKTILVIGGTGSIGSEIVRQCLKQRPKTIRVFSRDDTKHYELEQSLGPRDDMRYLVGDIRDRARVFRAVDGVDLIIHAAGMKHVPLSEYNPFEAVQTNIVGTQNVIDAALHARTPQIVFISTDKAVNPTTTMGATKLVAERLITATGQWATRTRMASVRFGNVLGSRGSVVPTVRKRLEAGLLPQLTDPAMTRFVMTIKQAVHLTLTVASDSMRGGEVFVLKMPAVQVKDLVSAVAGRGPVEIVGIRPGEKMHEELLTREEVRMTRETLDFLIVDPGRFADNPRPPHPKTYRSEDAPKLGVEEIERLLQ